MFEVRSGGGGGGPGGEGRRPRPGLQGGSEPLRRRDGRAMGPDTDWRGRTGPLARLQEGNEDVGERRVIARRETCVLCVCVCACFPWGGWVSLGGGSVLLVGERRRRERGRALRVGGGGKRKTGGWGSLIPGAAACARSAPPVGGASSEGLGCVRRVLCVGSSSSLACALPAVVRASRRPGLPFAFERTRPDGGARKGCARVWRCLQGRRFFGKQRRRTEGAGVARRRRRRGWGSGSWACSRGSPRRPSSSSSSAVPTTLR